MPFQPGLVEPFDHDIETEGFAIEADEGVSSPGGGNIGLIEHFSANDLVTVGTILH